MNSPGEDLSFGETFKVEENHIDAYLPKVESRKRKRSLTVPESPHLATSSRMRVGRVNPETEDRPRKRAKLADSDGAAHELSLTITEPFNLLVDQRAQVKASLKRQREEHGYESDNKAQQFVPLASRIKKWQDKTPERWKRDPRPRSPPYQPRLTQPEPFVFHTEQRVRRERISHQTESQEEQHDEDDVWPKPLTEPVSPHLRVDRRANREHVMDMTEHDRPAFNFPRYVAPKELTVPESPALQTKMRCSLRELMRMHRQPVEEAPVPFKARPVPMFEFPDVPPLPPPRPLTEPEPFFLRTDLRGEEMALRREMKREEEERVKKSQQQSFKAQPVPMDSPFRFVLPPTPKLTVPEPFNLFSDQRGALAQERLKARQEQENLQVRIKPLAMATTRKIVKAKTKRPAQPLADITNGQSNDRRQLNHKSAVKVHHDQSYDQVSVSKAMHKPFNVFPSVRPLTEPISPALHTKRSRRLNRDL
jgi:hypothetical protein